MVRKLIKAGFWVSLVVGLLSIAAGLVGAMYVYIRLTRDLPRIERISDYRPKAVTAVLSDDGTIIAEAYEERRYPVKFEEIPEMVRNAFLAAEDANFYSHPGIDIVSILRAVWVNLRSKETRQGASTITQQIVKSLLLTREKTLERKAKEAILSYRLEKALSKDEILEIYLNEIFLGSGAYGVRAAAKIHFGKELDQLSVAEAAWLAGLPQKPSELTNPKFREASLSRQRYVLSQMLRNEFIDESEYESAKEETLKIKDSDYGTIFATPYFASHVVRELDDIFRREVEGDESPIDPGGFVVETTVNVEAYNLAVKALRRNLRELDKRRGWRGPKVTGITEDQLPLEEWSSLLSLGDLRRGRIYPAVVTKVDRKAGVAAVELAGFLGTVDFKKATWAKRLLTKEDKAYGADPLTKVKPGDVIEVSLVDAPPTRGENSEAPAADADEPVLKLKLDQTPDVEGAMVVGNALTGEVKAIVGGYDYKRSQFNRATQGLLQPGSAFKPFIYLAALERLQYTPATIVPDSPISMIAGDGKLWSPQNYDHKFIGPITLRTALQRSRNVVSVYLLQRVGVESGIQVAKRLGITTPIPANMSISLGTAEVHLIDLVRAYGAFAAEGWLADRIIIKRIRDRSGRVVYEKRTNQEKVIDDENAFIMANMMRGVVERGTATRVKELARPVAGKTGTTNDQNDAWFVGYTPEWVAGVWVGFDVKRSLGRFETGGKAAAPAFVYFMKEFLKDTPAEEFNIPDGVIPVPINAETGQLIESDAPGAFIEYFRTGSEPRRTTREIQIPREYLTSDEF